MAAMFFPINKRKERSSSLPVHYKRTPGRMSLLFSATEKASATVEALLIMPLGFSFFMFFVFIMEAIAVHSIIGAIVNETGSEYVLLAHTSQYLLSDEEKLSTMVKVGEYVLSEELLRERINKSVAAERVENLIIVADTADEDILDIKVFYEVKPMIDLPLKKKLYLSNRFYSRKYIGNKRTFKESDFVYVTRESEVYHTSNSCISLKTTIEVVTKEEIMSKRNNDRKKYYSCETCGNIEAELLYITPYGTRYHTDRNCKNLICRAYKMPVAEIGERRKCYYCGR